MIIFIHGLMGSPSNWNQVISRLTFSNISYQSLKINYLSANYMNNFYMELYNKIDNKKIVGVGNSIGCKLLLETIDVYDKVILVAPPYKFLNKSAFSSKNRMEELKKEMFFNYDKIEKDEKEEIEKTISFWTGKTRDKNIIKKLKIIKSDLKEFDFTKYYEMYQEKIHFVLGKHDDITPVDEFLSYAKTYFPKAKITVLEESAHVLQMEQPDALYQIIKNEYGVCK